MNEKIKQLAILAGAKNITRCFGQGESHTALTLSNNTAYNSNEIDKFAELIIQECIEICDKVQIKYGQYTFTARICKEDIKEHFGVE
jgi:hypothetical protein